MTNIEWTEKTWNPATGCDKISSGCKNCYAETMAVRLKKMGQKKYQNGFEYTEHPEALSLPTSWKKPCRVFVNSMSDLFHGKATKEFLDQVFNVMINEAPQHTYQILTKRPQYMGYYVRTMIAPLAEPKLPKNIWLGVSVEDSNFKYRISILKRISAHVKFVSFEPLIGPVGNLNLFGIDWAIIGGESGPNHRTVKKEWITDIIRQCKEQNVAVFFKQWGGPTPKANGNKIDGMKYEEYPIVN